MKPKQKLALSTLSADQVAALDRLTRRLTAFGTFKELALAKRYRPTIRRDLTGFLGDVLAASYDAFQARSGEIKTAYRG